MSNINDFVIEEGVLKGYNGDRNIETIIIPNNVTEIHFAALGFYPSFKKIVLPDSIICIDSGAFLGCENLESINIPETVKRIEKDSFKECKSLKKLTIPKNVESIDDSAFSYCKSLNNINVAEENMHYCSIDGNLYSKDKTKLIQYALGKNDDTFSIPDGVDTIGAYAFSVCESLVKLSIPDSVREISSCTFFGCENIKTITIPESIAAILSPSFIYCTFPWKSVVNLYFEDKNYFGEAVQKKIIQFIKKYIEYILDIIFSKYEKDDSINRATWLKGFLEINKKQNLSDIDEYIKRAKGDAELTAVLLEYKNINYTTKKIAEYEQDKAEKAIGFKELTYKEWQKIFKLSKKDDGVIITGYKDKATEVFIPSKIGKYPVLGIGEKAFYGHGPATNRNAANITSVIISGGVKYIERDAFLRCFNLESVIINEGVQKIGYHAFQGCNNLKNIELPDSLISIGGDNFFDSITRRTTDFPYADNQDNWDNGELYIGNNLICVRSCDKKIYSIKKGTTLIASDAFDKNDTIEEIIVPNGVKAIDSNAFDKLKNLKKLVLPETLEYIGRCIISETNYWSSGCPLYNDEANWENDGLYFGKYLLAVRNLENKEEFKIKEGTEIAAQDMFLDLPSSAPIIVPKSLKTSKDVLVDYRYNKKIITDGTAQENEESSSEEKSADKVSDVTKSDEPKLPMIRTQDIKYSKLNELKKVLLLEDTVLYGTADEITEVMKKCKRFEFTARALGLACRYGGLEKVKALIGGGATFKYTPNANLNKKYKVSYKVAGNREITTAHYLVLAETEITDIFDFTTDRNLYGMISEDLPRISDEEKADIVEYLINSNKKSFDKGLTLYYAILWGCDKVADRLISLGAELDVSIIRYITEAKGGLWYKDELCNVLSVLPAKRCVKTMESLTGFLGDKKLILNKLIIKNFDSVFFSPEVLEYTIENTDISKIKRSEIIKSLVLNLRLPTLEMLAEKGWNAAKKEIENVKKNYNEEIEKIHKKQDETIAMSAEWESELLEDNSLKLTRCCEDKKVTVPSYIGVLPVTVLGCGCFAPDRDWLYWNYDMHESSSKIESVVIPEGIKTIEGCAFIGCNKIKEISLPSTLEEIETCAFAFCSQKLKNNLNVSEKVKYIESEAFKDWYE